MKHIKRENWNPSDGITLETAAAQAVFANGNCVITAGPGAGKTELLAQKASYLLQTNTCPFPKQILAISFKKDAAANLRDRVILRCGRELGCSFTSLTYDAFAKSLLDRFLCALPYEFAINPDYEVSFENNLANIGPRGHRRLNFKWIRKLAIIILKSNPKIRKALQLTYSHIFLDEFQDTTPTQYELVCTCFQDSACELTAVGDEKQRIMVWAGAMKDVFCRFSREYKAKHFELVMNHRSTPKLIALQMAMYESLNVAPTQISPDNHWNNEDGSAALLICRDDNHEAEVVAKEIANQIHTGKSSANDFCLICRNRPDIYTTKVISRLKQQGINARVESSFQDLIKEPLIDLIVRFVKFSLDSTNPKDREVLLSVFAEIRHVNTDEESKEYDEFVKELYKRLNATKKWIMNPQSPHNAETFIKRLVENYIGVDRIKAIYPEYSQGTYLSSVLRQVASAIQSEFDNGCTTWDSAIKSFLGVNTIPAMTIHKSKGLEFKSVYFLGLDDESFMKMAMCSRGTPRVANRLFKRVRDFSQVEGNGTIDLETTKKALEAMRVDEYGLEALDRELLTMIIERFNGGPVGIDTIAASLGEERITIEDVYEPYLIQAGFMHRTQNGRMVSDLAYKHLGIPLPEKD